MSRVRLPLFALVALTAALGATAASAQQCKSPLKGSQVPGKLNVASGKPGFYAPDSAIINVGNGQVYAGGVSRTEVENVMGSSFANAEFTVVGGPGSGSAYPGFSCSYDGPRFHHGSETLQATITLVCQGHGVCP